MKLGWKGMYIVGLLLGERRRSGGIFLGGREGLWVVVKTVILLLLCRFHHYLWKGILQWLDDRFLFFYVRVLIGWAFCGVSRFRSGLPGRGRGLGRRGRLLLFSFLRPGRVAV